MATFLVTETRSGPHWDRSRPMEHQTGWPAHAAFMDELVESGFVLLGGPLPDEHRVVLVIESASETALRARLARDPWIDTHLQIDSVERWTVRLDGLR